MSERTRFDYYRTRMLMLGDRELALDTWSEQFMRSLLELNARSQTEPILIVVNSGGGDADRMFGFIDLINSIEAPVYSQVLGVAASAAAIFATCCTKGHRYVSPSSRIMIHQPSSGVIGDVTEMEIATKEAKETRKMIAEMLADVTGQTEKTIIRDLERDTWMRAEAAVKYGLADTVGLLPELLTMPLPILDNDDDDEEGSLATLEQLSFVVEAIDND